MQLIYVGDPMCSWCYGFGPELQALLERYPHIPLRIVVGGLRAGGQEVLDDAGKAFRLQHWARVEALSGLPFNREALMARQGFVYDTEPVCRAVVAARCLAPSVQALQVFRDLQAAFYVEGRDTTDVGTLADIVAKALTHQGVKTDATEVLGYLNDRKVIERTRGDFDEARSWGVSSFPTLLVEQRGQVAVVSPGYARVDALDAALGRCININ